MDITQVAVGELALLHIVGNTTVIGRVKEKDGASITLTDPIELVLMMHPQQNVPIIGLVPYLSLHGKLSSLDEVSLHLSLVVTPRPIPDALERDYLSATSGIDLKTQLGGQNGAIRR